MRARPPWPSIIRRLQFNECDSDEYASAAKYMNRIKGILWDNDGVLVNTEHLFYESNRELFAEHGIDLTPQQFFDWFLIENCGAWHLLHDKGYSKTDTDALRASRNARYSRLLASADRLAVDGIEHTLHRLWKRIPMGVVTSAKAEHFDLIHQKLQLRRFFDFVVTEEDASDSKPSPEPYLLGLKRLGIAASECLAVEDSPRGLQAARAAGIACIVLKHPLTHGFLFDGAYRVVNDAAQLSDTIEMML
jgi:HAD superfamily hydrolase (TIGR01509 family)